MSSPFDDLAESLRLAGARPYINTAYLNHEQQGHAFRARSRAFLSGKRAPYRHMIFERPASVPVSRDAFDLPWHEAYEPQPMPTGARTPRDE